MSHVLDDDETLMRELKAALAARGEVTPQAREAARAAFSWRTIDEELMSLAHDSRLTDEVLVRSVHAARVVGFQGRDLTLEVEVDDGQVMGQVVPGQVCRVSLVVRSGQQDSVVTDESGIFTLTYEGAGPVRFTVEADGDTQSTVWISL